ncbi:MAG TPA: c-type cytochrome [Sulfurovum sp.]|nr:c-type cytochrome [Sulfurovum sp.]
MKKLTFFSLIAVTMLFTACGEETKKAAAEATAATREAVKEDTTKAVEAVKVKAEEMAAVTAEKAEEMKAAAASKVAEAAAVVKEKAEEVAAGEANTVPAAYEKCKSCHGVDGKTKAMGKSAVIAGQDKAALIASLNAYKAGTKNVTGMGMLMNGQVASMSDADIEAVAEYLSLIK